MTTTHKNAYLEAQMVVQQHMVNMQLKQQQSMLNNEALQNNHSNNGNQLPPHSQNQQSSSGIQHFVSTLKVNNTIKL